jgi:hypothetical protein
LEEPQNLGKVMLVGVVAKAAAIIQVTMVEMAEMARLLL